MPWKAAWRLYLSVLTDPESLLNSTFVEHSLRFVVHRQLLCVTGLILKLRVKRKSSILLLLLLNHNMTGSSIREQERSTRKGLGQTVKVVQRKHFIFFYVINILIRGRWLLIIFTWISLASPLNGVLQISRQYIHLIYQIIVPIIQL